MNERASIKFEEFIGMVTKHDLWSTGHGVMTGLLARPGARLELIRAHLQGFEVRGATFIGAGMYDSCVDGVVFRDVRMGGLFAQGVIWRDCKFIDVNMAKSDFENCTFANCSFINVTLTKSDVAGCQFSDCHVSDLIAPAVVIIESHFLRCEGSGLEVDRLSIQGSTFKGCAAARLSGTIGGADATVIEH